MIYNIPLVSYDISTKDLAIGKGSNIPILPIFIEEPPRGGYYGFHEGQLVWISNCNKETALILSQADKAAIVPISEVIRLTIAVMPVPIISRLMEDNASRSKPASIKVGYLELMGIPVTDHPLTWVRCAEFYRRLKWPDMWFEGPVELRV